MAFRTDKLHPDAATWLASYEEEYNGLVSHDTFDVLSEHEYQALHERTGCSAIPSMNIFTIKTDLEGWPKQVKSRIVVLGNKDPVDWSKADCYTPVVSQPIVHLMTALAIQTQTTLKQAECKNTFCNSVLPNDEPTVICPDNFYGRMALDELRVLSLGREVLEWLNQLEGRLPKDRRV
jgi:hypothetical protein